MAASIGPNFWGPNNNMMFTMEKLPKKNFELSKSTKKY